MLSAHPDWIGFHKGICQIGEKEPVSYEDEEEKAKNKLLFYIKKYNPVSLTWSALCYILGHWLLKYIWRSMFGGRDPTPQEVEELKADLEFNNDIFKDFRATFDNRPSELDRVGEREIYKELSPPQKRAVNLLRLHTESKQAAYMLEERGKTYVRHALMQSPFPKHLRYIEIPFYNALFSLRLDEIEIEQRVKKHTWQLQTYMIGKLQLAKADVTVEEPPIPTYESSPGQQEYFRVNINSKGKPMADQEEVNVGDRKPLIRPVLQLPTNQQAQVAVLSMSKNDFDEAGNRNFSYESWPGEADILAKRKRHHQELMCLVIWDAFQQRLSLRMTTEESKKSKKIEKGQKRSEEIKEIKEFQHSRKLEIIKLEIRVSFTRNSEGKITTVIDSDDDFYQRIAHWDFENMGYLAEIEYPNSGMGWQKNEEICWLQNERTKEKQNKEHRLAEKAAEIDFQKSNDNYFHSSASNVMLDSILNYFSEEFWERKEEWDLIKKSVKRFLKHEEIPEWIRRETTCTWNEKCGDEWKSLKDWAMAWTKFTVENSIREARDVKAMLEEEMLFRENTEWCLREYILWKNGRPFRLTSDFWEKIKLWKRNNNVQKRYFMERFSTYFKMEVESRRYEWQIVMNKLRRQSLVMHSELCKSDQTSSQNLLNDVEAFFAEVEKTKDRKRGGLSYRRPGPGWVRVGFNVDKFGSDKRWLGRDEGSWAVGYHGCREYGIENIRNIARSLEMLPGEQSGIAYKNETDCNRLSDTWGKPCGGGIYFADDIDWVAEYYGTAINGYKCVFQARLEPSKVRIPRNSHHPGAQIRMVDGERNVRVYGFCFKKMEVNPCQDEQFDDFIGPYGKM